MQVVATLIAIFVMIPILMLEQGWVISTLWDWFIVPFGAPQVGIATAIGACLIASIVRLGGYRTHQEATFEESISYLVRVFFMPLLAVAIGWVVKHFV